MSIVPPGFLRFNMELSRMELPGCISISGQMQNTVNFNITPSSGRYTGKRLAFSLTIKPSYPFDPPKVHSVDMLLHPNVCPNTGIVCLNVLRLEWMPVLGVEAVIMSVLCLLLDDTLIDYDNALNPNIHF